MGSLRRGVRVGLMVFVWALSVSALKAMPPPDSEEYVYIMLAYEAENLGADRPWWRQHYNLLLAYARGERLPGKDPDADAHARMRAFDVLGEQKVETVVPICRRILVERQQVPYTVERQYHIRSAAARALGKIGTLAARAVLEEALDATVHVQWRRGDKSGKGPEFGDILRALAKCGDAKSLDLIERYRTFDDPWIPKIVAYDAPPLRARLVVEGKVPADAKAVEAWEVLDREAVGSRQEIITPLRAALVKAGLLPPATGGFQPLKTLPAGATALLEPATGAPR